MTEIIPTDKKGDIVKVDLTTGESEQDVKRVRTALVDAMTSIDSEDKIFSTMNAGELVEMAKRGLEEVTKLRSVNTKQLLEGRVLFDRMIDSLDVKEKDLNRRQSMYVAIIKRGD